MIQEESKQKTAVFSGITFNDITAEYYREYTFPNNQRVVIDNPIWLNVSKSGGHRVIVANNSTVYIPPTWIKLQWFNKEGYSPVQF